MLSKCLNLTKTIRWVCNLFTQFFFVFFYDFFLPIGKQRICGANYPALFCRSEGLHVKLQVKLKWTTATLLTERVELRISLLTWIRLQPLWIYLFWITFLLNSAQPTRIVSRFLKMILKYYLRLYIKNMNFLTGKGVAVNIVYVQGPLKHYATPKWIVFPILFISLGNREYVHT